MPKENSFDSGYDSLLSDTASGTEENSNVESLSTLTPSVSTLTPAESKGPLPPPPLPPPMPSPSPSPSPSLENNTIAMLEQKVEDFKNSTFPEAGKQFILKGLYMTINHLKTNLGENDLVPKNIVDSLKKLNTFSSSQHKTEKKWLTVNTQPVAQPVAASSTANNSRLLKTENKHHSQLIEEMLNAAISLSPEQRKKLKNMLDNKKNISLWTALIDDEKYKSTSTPDEFLKEFSRGKMIDILNLVKEELNNRLKYLEDFHRIKEDIINEYDEDEYKQLETGQKSRIEELQKYEKFLKALQSTKQNKNLHVPTFNVNTLKKINSIKSDNTLRIDVFEIDREEKGTLQEIFDDELHENKFNFLTYKDQQNKSLVCVRADDIDGIFKDLNNLKDEKENKIKILKNALSASCRDEKNNRVLNKYEDKEKRLFNFIIFLENLKKKQKKN